MKNLLSPFIEVRELAGVEIDGCESEIESRLPPIGCPTSLLVNRIKSRSRGYTRVQVGAVAT